MDLKKNMTFNEMCDMEARGETCPELEEAHKTMMSAVENLRTVLPDSQHLEEVLRKMNSSSALDQLKQTAIFDSSVLKLSHDLEAMNLGVTSSIRKLTKDLETTSFAKVTSRLADFEKLRTTGLEIPQLGYSGSVLKNLDFGINQLPARPSFTSVVPMNSLPDIQELGTAPIQQLAEIVSAPQKAMKDNLVLLIEQMKAQTANSEKLLNISIATSQGNIASKKRNDRQFIVMVVLSLLMAWGSIPTIINTVTSILHWLKHYVR